MLPYAARFAAHHIKRTRGSIEREALPTVSLFLSEAEFAGRAERQAKHQIELRLVAVPADTGTGLILGEQHVPDRARRKCRKRLSPRCGGHNPGRQRFSRVQPLVRKVVTPSK